MAHWSVSLPIVCAADLDRFEADCGLSLPPDYRSFLLDYNGCPDPNVFHVPDLGEDVLVGVLYRIRSSRSGCDLLAEYREEIDRLPPGFLIIGHDPGGNRLLLGTLGEDRGRVYYWDSCYFFPQSNDEDGNTFLVAESFQEFLDGLAPLEGEDDD